MVNMYYLAIVVKWWSNNAEKNTWTLRILICTSEDYQFITTIHNSPYTQANSSRHFTYEEFVPDANR
ncbi:hypothetical protein EYC84_005648 [Monilinia fructicola]|uniref:Uncharacterized protein n=1 Tax=Monilinia fructicola TaxID=38448 RepID=A0A5M9K1W8_MONFR|nr:hypothetical protein EYC84_005648 [Monilinia fructicola]